MANRKNTFQEAAEEVGQELARQKREDRERSTAVVPFGMERASAEQWRQSVASDQAFRQAELEKMGQREFIKRFRERKHAS